jgi:hypothetical protein
LPLRRRSRPDLPTKKPAPPPPAPIVQSSPWRFELTGYGWASSLSGYAGIRNFPALPFYANFPKIVEHPGGVFMGAATPSNGTYIVGVDFICSRLVGASRQKTRRRRSVSSPTRASLRTGPS